MSCRNCGAPLPDLGGQATGACPSCGTLYGERAELEEYAAAVVSGQPVARPKELDTSRLKVSFEPAVSGDYRSPGAGGTLTISLRYLNPMTLLAFFLGVVALAALGYVWYLAVEQSSFLAPTLVSLPLGLYAWKRLTSIFDGLLIRVAEGKLYCRQSRFWPRVQSELSAKDITQLFTAKMGRGYCLYARLADGKVKPLIRHIGNPVLGVYFERQIEVALGLQDRPEQQELAKNRKLPGRASRPLAVVMEVAVLSLLVGIPMFTLKGCSTGLAELSVGDQPSEVGFELEEGANVKLTSEIDLATHDWRYRDDIPRAFTFEIEILQGQKSVTRLSCDPFDVFVWVSSSDNHYVDSFWGPMNHCSTKLGSGHYTLRAVRKWKPNMQRLPLDASKLGVRKD
ncbi:MAG: hypothetical protein KC776_17450 [Myxococcales bacterium]|nr:hypothetical protein [Myxococcales bacterium]